MEVRRIINGEQATKMREKRNREERRKTIAVNIDKCLKDDDKMI
jgi:hypothetical protein